jgi:hypothetical protein
MVFLAKLFYKHILSSLQELNLLRWYLGAPHHPSFSCFTDNLSLGPYFMPTLTWSSLVHSFGIDSPRSRLYHFYSSRTFIIVSFLFFPGSTRTWIQASCLVGRFSATWTTPAALFVLVVFQIRSQVFVLASLDLDPPIYASCIFGITGAHQHA